MNVLTVGECCGARYKAMGATRTVERRCAWNHKERKCWSVVVSGGEHGESELEAVEEIGSEQETECVYWLYVLRKTGVCIM